LVLFIIVIPPLRAFPPNKSDESAKTPRPHPLAAAQRSKKVFNFFFVQLAPSFVIGRPIFLKWFQGAIAALCSQHEAPFLYFLILILILVFLKFFYFFFFKFVFF